MKKITFSIVLVVLFLSVSGQSFETKEQRMKWWQDSRFGMFIHWGPVSLKGTEIGWSRGREISVDEYDNLYKQFNPVNFNADEWVNIAKAAGMKYIVLTTKHHDGFCLWSTKQTEYNIMNTPFKRDVVKELSDACKKQGIAFGTYYSTCDWHHPDFPLTSPGGKTERIKSNLDSYTNYLKRQVAELLMNYGPLSTVWFDVPQKFDSIRGRGVIDFVRVFQPDILINNRTGANGDYDTPEQQVGSFQNHRPWETCMTIARQWAWKPNDEVKSLEQCLHSLIRSAGGDGNLLFNVGPGPDGQIDPLQVERLKEMGKWLEKYGYSIYETRGGPFKPTDWGVSTRSGNKLFLHVLNWFGDSPKIVLPDFGMDIKNCRLVDGGKIKYSRQRGGGYILQFSSADMKPIDTIIEVEVTGNAMKIAPVDILSQSLSFRKKISASSNPSPHWNDVTNIVNGDWVGHFWIPSKDDPVPWIEIDLGKNEKISKAILYESGKAVKSFKLQYKSGTVWKTFFKGKTIGEKAEISFPKVEVRQVRLIITETSEIPGIYEVVLL